MSACINGSTSLGHRRSKEGEGACKTWPFLKNVYARATTMHGAGMGTLGLMKCQAYVR